MTRCIHDYTPIKALQSFTFVLNHSFKVCHGVSFSPVLIDITEQPIGANFNVKIYMEVM